MAIKHAKVVCARITMSVTTFEASMLKIKIYQMKNTNTKISLTYKDVII